MSNPHSENMHAYSEQSAFVPIPTPEASHKLQVDYYRQYLLHAKGLVSNLGHDYRVLGHRYHSLPPYVRYHNVARADGIHLDAARNFVVSDNYELPELITMLGTFEFVIEKIDVVLADPVGSIDLRKTQSMFTMLETQIPYALVLLAKLQIIMRIYVEVVANLKNIRRALQSRWAGDRRERRMQNMLDKWFQALPEVCFDGYPEAFENGGEQERRHVL